MILAHHLQDSVKDVRWHIRVCLAHAAHVIGLLNLHLHSRGVVGQLVSCLLHELPCGNLRPGYGHGEGVYLSQHQYCFALPFAGHCLMKAVKELLALL